MSRGAEPLHVAGPQAPWEPVFDRAVEQGRAVVHTTWGEWLPAVLLDPELRTLLGADWPRYRQTPAPAGRFRFVASRLVMKYAAAAVLQTAPAGLDLVYRPGGRPRLRGLGAELELSLAHTGELIAVGVSRCGPIGVDVEPVDREVSFELLRDEVCTPAEAAELAALPEELRTARLVCLWTLKEAYTKALGHGVRRRFSGFGFRWDAAGAAVLDEDPGTAGGWAFETHPVGGGHLLSVAHRHLAPAPRGAGPVEEASRPDPGPLEQNPLPPVRTLGFPGVVGSGGR